MFREIVSFSTFSFAIFLLCLIRSIERDIDVCELIHARLLRQRTERIVGEMGTIRQMETRQMREQTAREGTHTQTNIQTEK